MATRAKAELELLRFVEKEFPTKAKRVRASKLIAAFVAAVVRDDRAGRRSMIDGRSLFGIVFGDRK